jgi:hypothetical protein
MKQTILDLDIDKHKLDDIRTDGDYCFNHIIGIPHKNDLETPIYDHEILLYDSLLIVDFYNPTEI